MIRIFVHPPVPDLRIFGGTTIISKQLTHRKTNMKMPKIFGIIALLIPAIPASAADWWFVDYYPWVWSTSSERWEYAWPLGVDLYSPSSEAIRTLGWKYDGQAHQGLTIISLEEDELLLSYGYSGVTSGLWIQFGTSEESTLVEAAYTHTYTPSDGTVTFFAQGDTVQFSLRLTFTSPSGGDYILQGSFPDRENQENGLYISSGKFKL